MQYKASNKYYRLLVFYIGIIATFAYRVIVVLNHYSSLWVEIAWHVGTIGFIWYFAHRYRVENYFSQIIKERKLEEKVCNGDALNKKDCEALVFLLSSLKSSKAKWNSIAIFVLSAIALLYSLYINLANIIQ